MTDVLLPRLEGLTAEFHGWLADGQLRVQRCTECGVLRHVPRYLCAVCGSDTYDWALCTGGGSLYSWTITHRALHPAFTDTPFTIAVIALDEGPRIVAPLVGGSEAPSAGVRVQLQIREVDGVHLPAFRPVDRPTDSTA